MAIHNPPLSQNAIMDSTKLLMDQAVANAKGIAQINTNLEQYHAETMEGIKTVQETQKKLDDIMGDLKLMSMKQDSHTELLAAKSGDIHTTTSFTQKITIAFSCIITALLLVLCLMTWNEIKAEAETESIISKYQEILDEYGIEFPEFPEFPEMNLSGTEE